jgi:Na+-transporting NADH:ubiquinone oxidoreductase subunit NqrF
MTPISRGFLGRRRPVADPSRVPPGQYLTDDFPVLSAGPTPDTRKDEWSFTIHGAVGEPVSWPWDEFLALPSEAFVVDIHCVMKWSKLRSMLRHCTAVASAVPLRLLYSARSLTEVIYREELTRFAAQEGVDVQFTLTREWPQDWRGHRGRIDRRLLGEVAWRPDAAPLTYICGPSGFVEAAATALVQSGHEPGRIRTERFGPSGT